MESLAAAVVLIAILIGILIVIAFDLYCLVHLANSLRVRYLPRLAWSVLIVFVSPLGGVAYLLSHRQPRRLPAASH